MRPRQPAFGQGLHATGLYTYPDVVVFCGQPQLQDAHLDTLLNPTLLIEVLSPSTEAYDRGRKFEHYRSIDSLQEYLLVASDRMHSDLYTRQADGRWILTSAGHPQDKLVLTSIGYSRWPICTAGPTSPLKRKRLDQPVQFHLQ